MLNLLLAVGDPIILFEYTQCGILRIFDGPAVMQSENLTSTSNTGVSASLHKFRNFNIMFKSEFLRYKYSVKIKNIISKNEKQANSSFHHHKSATCFQKIKPPSICISSPSVSALSIYGAGSKKYNSLLFYSTIIQKRKKKTLKYEPRLYLKKIITDTHPVYEGIKISSWKI